MKYIKYIEAAAAILLVFVDLAKRLAPQVIPACKDAWERAKAIWLKAGQ